MTLTLPIAGERLSEWLLNKAFTGLPPLKSAGDLAASYASDRRHPHNEARIDALVRWEIAKNFTAGFVTGLAGLVTMPVALPANLGAVWLLQARMAAAMAHLRGHSLDDPWVQSGVLISLMGAAAPELLRHGGVRAGEWAAQRALLQISEKTLQDINRRVGFRLLATAGEHGAVRLSRVVPVAGAVVGGAIDAYSARVVARTARRVFAPQLLLTGR